MRFWKLAVSVAAASLVAVSGVSAPAVADTSHPGVVSANPVDWTPHVLDGTVHAITVVDNMVVVGGEFTSVRDSAGATYSRSNIFAFDRSTGAVSQQFAPQIDNSVLALAPGPSSTVYVGGKFKNIDGVEHRRLARLGMVDGEVVQNFARANVLPEREVRGSAIDYGVVQALIRRGDNLYVGGTFNQLTDDVTGVTRSRLARINADTGAVDPAFDLTVSEPRQGTLGVVHMAVDPDEQRLVINGTFTKVNDQRRYQIALIDLAGIPALSSWATEEFSDACSDPNWDTYTRGMDFAPDGTYFVVTTSGGNNDGTSDLCTSASRWEADRSGPGQKPTWVNYTGGDTLLSVSITGPAIYVGGHQRWMDNPSGNGGPGPGAVIREGIAAIHPTTGKAADISWNPSRTRGHGVEALVADEGGLFVGSDTEELGHEYHARLGMFPLP